MKKLSLLVLGFVFVFSAFGQSKKADETKVIVGFAQDYSCAKGNLADGVKGMTKASKHSKNCALEDNCSASGYGVWSDNKFYKLDEKGNKLMLTLYKETDTKKGMKVSVKGIVKDDLILVTELKEVKEEKKS